MDPWEIRNGIRKKKEAGAMNREEAKNYIKGQEPSFLQKAKRIGGKPSYICPKCGNGDGKEGTGITRDPGNGGQNYKCFKCGLYADVIELWKINTGTDDNREAFNALYSFYGITIDAAPQHDREKEAKKPMEEKKTSPAAVDPEKKEAPATDFTGLFLQAAQNIEKTDYHRGLPLELLKRYKVGYMEGWKHPKRYDKPAGHLIIPITEYTYLARLTRPRTDKEREENRPEKALVKGKEEGASWIFNHKAIEKGCKAPVIFVVEGAIDALSIIAAGGEAVALSSTAFVGQLLELVKNHRPKVPLVLSLDNDAEKEDGRNPGQEAEERLAAGLEELGIPFYRYNVAGEYKDANDRLREDPEGLARAVEKGKKLPEEEYRKESARGYIQAFLNGIADSANTPRIYTGFSRLDNALDGGLYEGLYTIGAISSLGKTALVMQIVDQIAAAGHDVLVFSLEMARYELMARSISRQTYITALADGTEPSKAKTARGITDASRWERYGKEEIGLIKKSTNEYEKYAGHIFIQEGIGDIGVTQIREAIERHISFTGKAPVVVVDYLQLLAPRDIRATDKQNIDKNVMECKRISRDFKIPFLAISSFNRENYKNEATMAAFKESGAIEYSSDVLIGLQLQGAGKSDFNAKKAMGENPRRVELVILKNRGGKVGTTITFEYFPMFNYFMEEATGAAAFKR